MLPPQAARQLFVATVAPAMDYAFVVWAHARGERELKEFNRAQKIGARAITGAFQTVARAVAEAEANIQTVHERHALAGMKLYINMHTLPKKHPLATLKVSVSRRYISPMKRLALALGGSGIGRMETIEAYTAPPWHARVSLVCEVERKMAIAAANSAEDITITTSASDKGGMVGMGGIVSHRAAGQANRVVARYSVTLGSRDDQNPYMAELGVIAMALRCMPDGLRDRRLTILSSGQSALKAIARPRQQSGQCAIRGHLQPHPTAGKRQQQCSNDLGTVPGRRVPLGTQGEETGAESNRSRTYGRDAAIPSSIDADKAGESTATTAPGATGQSGRLLQEG